MKHLKNKRVILFGVLCLGFANISQAQTPIQNSAEPLNQAKAAPAAKAIKTPDVLLKNAIDKIIGFLRNNGASDLGQILNFIDRNISGYFDFTHMTTLAAGRHARNMTQGELEELSYEVRKTFIESFSRNLVDYAFTNKKIRFYKPRRSRYGNEVTVAAKITHPQGYPTRITFRFHPTKMGWKVYDISADGQSAILHYRSQIRNMYSGYNNYYYPQY